jgi:glycosyltransferase EpsF
MDRGGAETRTMEVYRNIDRTKVQFDFLNLESGTHHYDKEIELLGGRKFVVVHPKEGFFSHFISIYQIMKNEGPFQAVHAHTAHHEGIVSLAARLAKVRYRICHARTTSSKNISSLMKKLAIQVGRRLILINATSLLAISYKAGEYLFGKKAFLENRVHVVPNAIDLIPYSNIEDLDVWSYRENMGIPESQLLIGHVGRFNHMKNHEFLLRLLKEMRDQGIDVRLAFVGDGELRVDMEREAENLGIRSFVHFLGIREDVPNIMRVFDVFIMPSKYEGLGGAAIEAQAAGTPCVLSTSLPDEVDMGLDIVRFISLESPLERWIEAIEHQSNIARPQRTEIARRFKERKFTIEAEIESFLYYYGLSNLS